MDRYYYMLQDKLAELQRKPYFWLALLFLVSAVICLGALRHNNTTMVSLRSEVYAADKNNGDVEGALDNLRAYVYAHMNTNLSTGTNIRPPIQLKYTYQRLVEQAKPLTNNPQLYIDANNYCQGQVPANCVADYIASHGGVQAKTIPVGLYEFDFISPDWSPDLAGWSLIATIVLAMAAAATFLLSRFSRFKV